MIRISDVYLERTARRARSTAAMAIVFYMAIVVLCLMSESTAPAVLGLGVTVYSSVARYIRLSEALDRHDRTLN